MLIATFTIVNPTNTDHTMTNEMIGKFQDWWNQAKADPSLKHKGAMCVSSIDEFGFPNARFVASSCATSCLCCVRRSVKPKYPFRTTGVAT